MTYVLERQKLVQEMKILPKVLESIILLYSNEIDIASMESYERQSKKIENLQKLKNLQNNVENNVDELQLQLEKIERTNSEKLVEFKNEKQLAIQNNLRNKIKPIISVLQMWDINV